MTSTIAKTLTDAKNLLIEKGRIHTDLINADGCMCALGAIGVAAVGEEKLREIGYGLFNPTSVVGSKEAYEATVAVAEELDDQYEADGFSADHVVWRFNDAHERTDEEVLALFDRVIAAQGK